MTTLSLAIDSGLANDLRVAQITTRVGYPDRYPVIGRLITFWSWARRIAPDGELPQVSTDFIDETLNLPGIADAMIEVGMLEKTPSGLRIPDFDNTFGDRAIERIGRRVKMRRYRANVKSCRATSAGAECRATPETTNDSPETAVSASKSPISRATPEPGGGIGGGLRLVSGVEQSSGKPEKKKKGPRRAKKHTTIRTIDEVEVPMLLDTPDFRAAYDGWLHDRTDRGKPCTRRAVELQLRDCLRWGPEESIANIERAIDRAYTGIFPPDDSRVRIAASDGNGRRALPDDLEG